MRRLNCAIFVACGVVFGSSALAADNFCDAILTSKAFDTYDTGYQSQINVATADLVCTLHISSREELRNQSQNLKAGGQYGIISGFFDAAEASGSESYEDTYDKACNRHDRNFVQNIFSHNRSQATSANIAAWEHCVLERRGIFSALHPSLDGKTYTITVHYLKPDFAPEKLVLLGVDQKYGFDCTVSGESVNGFVPTDKGLNSEFGATCVRDSDKTNNTILINSNAGNIGPFDVPSRPFDDLVSRVEQLEGALAAAQKKETEDAKKIAEDRATIQDIESYSRFSLTNNVGCPKNHPEIGEVFALHDSKGPPRPPIIEGFTYSGGPSASGLTDHEWLLFHVCRW